MPDGSNQTESGKRGGIKLRNLLSIEKQAFLKRFINHQNNNADHQKRRNLVDDAEIFG
jgi:hypothetical protein